jgi:hypothetical protein
VINFYLKFSVISASDDLLLRKTIAVLLALLFSQEYPTHWQSFWNDFFSTLQSGPNSVDVKTFFLFTLQTNFLKSFSQMFLRILTSIDSEVISPDAVRNVQEAARANEIVNWGCKIFLF